MSDSYHPIISSSPMLTRRKFVYGGIAGLSGLALAGCVNGIGSRNDIEVTHRTFSLPALPDAFEGFTITLASDIHSSPYMGVEEMKQIASQINALQSDLIVIPGDFVTSHIDEIGPFVEAMAGLKAPFGVHCSTGNHDYYCGVDKVTRGLEEIGFKILRNENHTIIRDGQKLSIVGVDDNDSEQVREFVEGKSAPHIEAAFKGVDVPQASILLNHKPYDFEGFAAMNVGLMLSGHTHGGQIVFGRVGGSVLALSSIASHFVEGRYTSTQPKSQSQLYVSRGLGVVGLPIRINCPPEITRITLTKLPIAS